MTGDTSSSTGLVLSNMASIRSFLESASKDPTISSDVSSQPSISYKSVRSIWSKSDPNTRPDLLSLFSGSEFLFNSPKPREKGLDWLRESHIKFIRVLADAESRILDNQSEELKARLKKLQELADRKEYAELVKDITPRKGTDEPFSSYKDQLGFGLHVVVTMFTGYLVGYAAFRALFSHSPVMNAAGGILGLVGAMLIETLLFIIRASNQENRSSSSTSQLKKNQ